MMFFAHNWVLLLLAIPVVLAVWECNRGGHPIRLPFDHAAPRHHRWLGLAVLAANLLPAFLLAVAIVMAAGPRRFAPPKDERIMTNIQFCLDCSGSMGVPLPGGGFNKQENRPASRFDGAMAAINNFTAQRPKDTFGLTVFGNEYLHWTPLTKDASAIAYAAPFVAPGRLPKWFGGTEIGKALLGCREELVRRPTGDRMIVLVSDGDSADFGNGNDIRVASTLSESKITVYMICIGQQAPPEMASVAMLTGGAVFSASDKAGLKTIFDHIDKMQKVRFKQSAPSAVDWFEPFAIAGLVLALLAALALLGLRHTPW